MPDIGIANLTDAEANFVYNVVVLGLPAAKAAKLAGMPLRKQCNPNVMQAREQLRAHMRGNMNFTKEDIVFGMHDAIGRARILAEPMTEIVGWEKIAKLLGHDTPTVDINVTHTIEVLQDRIKTIPTDELVKRLGAGNVIDADFYEISQNPS